jgi:transcription elongation factor S-II
MKITEPTVFRQNIVDKLKEKLEEKSAVNLEKGIYNWSVREASSRKIVKKWDNHSFVQIYVDRLRSIMTNLKGETLKSLKEGSIKAHVIAFMTHQELSPDKWATLIIAKTKRDKNKFETNIEAATDTFKCGKCHSTKCTYYQMQTRSADEPMTTFVTCIDCGKRWKC